MTFVIIGHSTSLNNYALVLLLRGDEEEAIKLGTNMEGYESP